MADRQRERESETDRYTSERKKERKELVIGTFLCLRAVARILYALMKMKKVADALFSSLLLLLLLFFLLLLLLFHVFGL